MSGSRLFRAALSLVFAIGLYGCGSSSTGGGTTGGTTTSAPTSTYVIESLGGIANLLVGGDGGELEMTNFGLSGVNVIRTGSLDAAFSSVVSTVISLGTNALIINADTTINPVAIGASDPALGVAYTIVNGTNIYVSDGDGTSGDEAAVTGLQVDAGYTLTMGLNANLTNATGRDTARVAFTNSVYILGTVKTRDLTTGTSLGESTVDLRHNATAVARDMGSLDITADKVLILGTVDTTGTSGAVSGQRGGDAGAVMLTTGAEGIHVSSSAIINASGGRGIDAIGGWAGVSDNNVASGVSLATTGVIVNNGAVASNGGSGTTGGKGAFVTMTSDLNLSSTGAIGSFGGDGTTGPGGDGGGADLLSTGASARNSGAIIANGGSGAGGGASGSVIVEAGTGSGDVINSGSLKATGGSALTAGGGGAGGSIFLVADLGDIMGTGSLEANGGDATGGANVGGAGGIITVSNGNLTSAGYLQLACDIKANGGGGPNGGAGGIISIVQDDSASDAIAGGIELYNYDGADASGGNGVTFGGAGSAFAIVMTAFGNTLTTDIGLTSVGGDASGPAGTAGDGGVVDLGALTDLTNTGTITVTGGTSPFVGGSATGVSLIAGDQTVNTGSIYCNGGDSTTTVASSVAGDGGDVVLASAAPPATANSAGLITVAKGTGGALTAGPGTITIDGVDVTPVDATLP